MKKKLIIILLIISVIFFNSCKKEEKPENDFTDHFIEGEYDYNSSGSASSATAQGFCLFTNAGFYIMSGDDTGDETTKTKWSASIALGERLLIGNTRRMLLESDNRVYDFTEVRRLSNNTEGYALAWQIAAAGELAVIIGENVNLYRTARIVDVSGTVLTRRSVIVYYPESETDGFVQIRGYDIGRRQYIAENNNYIRNDTFSRRDSDIQSAILLQTALTLTAERQASQREALLKSALEYYSDSIFYDEVFETAFPDAGVIHEDSSLRESLESETSGN